MKLKPGDKVKIKPIEPNPQLDARNRAARIARQRQDEYGARAIIGDPFVTAHSGCEGGPYIKLRYETVAEMAEAHDAIHAALAAASPAPQDRESKTDV